MNNMGTKEMSEKQRGDHGALTEEQRLDLIAGTIADRAWNEMKKDRYTSREMMQDREYTRRVNGWCR